MESQEIPITITPQQAAHGVILTVTLATGAARLRIPPSRDGDLVRARLGQDEVLLRIRVAPGPGPAPAPASSSRGCLVALGIVVAIVIGAILLNSGGDDGDSTANRTPTPTPSYSSWSPAPAPPPVNSSSDPLAPPSEEPAPSPFDRGTCLNGTLPDSTTPTKVTGVEEVSCSASDAHYKVIESIPLTSELDRCNSNPKTQYAFSYRYSRGGITINEYVYCLVGLGSYARG
ncbi:LppU/SCO3897 family protein [Streptomyces sp. NBC_00354]|uniref:LppU/SCO3897 family protein n=1 Tax=Streptomyces sp. NBC_00354 TaxID=2975723 RepID=UPI002E265C77